ncbi:polyketide synthase [Hymenobacter sp. GOD-10R]|uniref:polyketide synthase n=1 Tax=Hymenobacter sp. GOD-10R TaxID=3093922 RepID=UPI002D78F700|nr:polyketide synthase [Hymenobacter sp. GOD-10R]WRQ27831.1 amino acid adenylation domain-containing protein [Hymenobacter sp. GOD-10R]
MNESATTNTSIYERGEGLFVQQLFEESAAKYQDKIAVICNEEKITYAELDEAANKLSNAILYNHYHDEIIGISNSREIEMIVGILAILKAGKAYLPLDHRYPQQRITQIIANSKITACVATTKDSELLELAGLKVITSDKQHGFPAQAVANRSEVAYVLYTSGSTGVPKGVCMGHKPLVNLIEWQNENSTAAIDARTLQFAPISFDVSFQEIFATLTTGGTLLLIDEETRIDLDRLLRFVELKSINRVFLPFVALQYLAEAAVNAQRFPLSLKEVMTAGEQLKITPQLVEFFSKLPGCVLYNQYGPTECHVVTQLILDGDASAWPPLPTIGSAIANTVLFMVDDKLALLPDGEVGEVCISGICLAEGYLNQPELTKEKFCYWRNDRGESIRIYRTGDLGRFLPDGTIEFLGRRDDQVKIRGYRIELAEVEVALNEINGIRQAVVVAQETASGQKQLVAYVVASAMQQDTSAVRKLLEARLPEYMVPSAFVWMDDFPKTSSGKVDKKLLPKPEGKRPSLTTLYRKPTTAIEKNIVSTLCDLLGIDKVGLDDNFFELGGSSLLAQRTVAALKKQYNYVLPVTKLYQHPTVATIVDYLSQHASVKSKAATENAVRVENTSDVAVIGMSGRFPGAASIDELWEVLKQGKETTSFFTEAELDSTLPSLLTKDPLYVKARGIIDSADQFDAFFFGLNSKLAEAMDPQQRVFLEIAWEALEQSGHLPAHYDGRIGVFAGCGNNTYYWHNLAGNEEVINRVGSFQIMTVNEKDYLASRTAYTLNLKGPAVSVYSACSTSLLAIAQAVQSIRAGHCEVALAGGSSITSPVRSGHLYEEGAMLSPDGHCRSFDADAQGTVFSDGAGVVLLKSLEAAKRDGDTIYAVIKGVGVNNDGSNKGSFTAPSAEGQASAIAMAIANAQIEAASISYVEAHGTATPLGDPIEIEGLSMAFGEQSSTQFCAIGSIKSNMGHLTAAAGVTGFIKTVLALHHKQLPPSLGFEKPNPAIDFNNSPFFVNTKLSPWQSQSVRRAGVSSFGVGGTNVHVVLEEGEAESVPTTSGRPLQLVTWSAKSDVSRDAYGQRLAEHVRQTPSADLADLAFTLHTTRPAFNYRRFVMAANQDELSEALLNTNVPSSEISSLKARPDEVVFLFPGQGSQYLNMGRTLYENETVYRQAVDECAELLQAHIDTDIRQIIFPEANSPESEDRLKNTRYTQPALFVTEYAVAKLWMSWGITPSIFCGHSIGEFVAAHLAGIFTLADALLLIATRGKMVSELPRGSMLSVRMEVEKVEELLPKNLSVAAINSTKLCVVAGQDEDVATFARMLDSQSIPNRVLATSHAFHSAMMDPIVDDFRQVVAKVTLHQPQKPMISTVSGTWLTEAQATSPDYWATHLRATVRFADALETVLAQESPLLLEVGPGNVTATLARQQAGTRPVVVLASLAAPKGAQAEYQTILKTLGQLWLNGVEPDWHAFYADQTRKRILLPTYAFDRKRCWIDSLQKPTTTINTAELPVQEFASITETHLPTTMRKSILLTRVKTILEDASGIDMDGVTPEMSFLEIGLDSLLLTQVVLMLKREFELPITFRQLNEEYATLDLLTSYLDSKLPADAYQPAPAVIPPAPSIAPVAALAQSAAVQAAPAPITLQAAPVMMLPIGASLPAGNDSPLGLIAQQLHILAKQMNMLQGGGQVLPVSSPTAVPMPSAPTEPVVTVPSFSVKPTAASADLTPEEAVEIKKPFGAAARIERQTTELSPAQQHFLQQLTFRYNQKTAGSKTYAQQHRSYMADPRVVSGFKPLTKEIVYPIVVNRSRGSRLWDVDGNEYIDVLSGFGSNLLGYQPDIIKDALADQIEKGFEVGPQHELAGEVSQLICAFTGLERAALCNTGSEAVLGAMRIARTVTGRSLIVAFSGSYHGINDEVLIRGTKKLKSFPAAPGIMPEAVQNMLILDYGTEESLRIISERASELAAVLVEPVQSRRPEFRPIDFLKKLRAVTAASGTALIFDEVITGFRMHPGGAQALFGIKADLATYGKVIGGGLPIGAIAGKKEFMDALDGGFWQYGDASVPEAGVTYFAGTFVRHPLALAAAKASLHYMKERGAALQRSLTGKAERLTETLNREFERQGLPFFVAQFGSLWKIKFKEEIPYSELLFTLMRERGIHVWDGFPCFMTEAHTEKEIDTVIDLFLDCVNQLVAVGFFKGNGIPALTAATVNGLASGTSQPPVPGAKLGRDKDGNPAWFISDPEQPGKYFQIKSY